MIPYDHWVLDLQGAELLALKGAENSIKFSSQNLIQPLVILPGGGTKPRIDRALTLFPEPDSPRIPKASPYLTEKEIFFTASTSTPLVEKEMLKSFTSNIGLPI